MTEKESGKKESTGKDVMSKRPYAAPVLQEYGDLAELTQGTGARTPEPTGGSTFF